MRTCEVDTCPNSVFGTDRITKKGYCMYHQYLRTDRIKHSSKKLVGIDAARKVQHAAIMSEWFEYVAAVIALDPRCWECREHISVADYRCAAAHIFPKATFESIRDHASNFLVLGCRCGCHEKSHRIDTFCKMKVWKMAVERFREFEGCITERHKYLRLFKEAIDGEQ